MNKIIGIVLVATIFKTSQAKFFDPEKHVVKHSLSADVGETLILTPYLEANETEQARIAAQVNYTGFQNVASYSGYFTVDKTYDSNLFFWFFPSANDYENDPVLLWLQGGPGSSSLYGLFEEHGPFIINETLEVELREYSWHRNHSVLYIDSPAGTGFSFTNEGYAENQTKVGDDLYSALTQFFTLFPELQSNEFFVSGESYAGKYVPSIGHTIHMNNHMGAPLQINLQGLLIGNGWSDPENMFVYSDYLYQLGLIDVDQREVIKATEEQTVEYIKEGDYTNGTFGFQTIILFTYTSLFVNYTGLGNVYNFLYAVDDDPAYYQDFINQDEVRKALHVGNVSFGAQSNDVYYELYDDISMSVAPWISELLSHHRVLIFNGQLDVVVGYPLTANYLQNLNFSSAEEYQTAERHIWTVDNEVAGYSKVAGNLTEVLVRDASHMVPIEQPKWAWDLVYKFIRNVPLS